MKSRIMLAALALGLPALAHAETQAPAAATVSQPAFTTSETELSAILENPAAKAVLAKYLPDLAADERAAMAGSLTLKALQAYVPTITDEVLAKMDADLAKLPAAK